MRHINTFLVTTILLTLSGCVPKSTDANTAGPTVSTPFASKDSAQAANILAEAQAKADAILAEAEAIKTEAKREAAKVEINLLNNRLLELTDEIKRDGQSELMLARFEVQAASLYLNPEGFPEMTIGVINNTKEPVSRVYLHGVFKAPFREVPFAEGDFNYHIPGGINPNERTELKLDATSFIAADDFPEDRDNLQFNVNVARIDDAHGDAILDRTNARATQEEYDRIKIKIAELQDLVPGYIPPPPPAPPEPLPDAADTPPIQAKPEITGNVYVLNDIYHVDRDCAEIGKAIPSVTKAENARKRRLQPCPKCTGH